MLQSKARLDQYENHISNANALKDLSEVLADAKKDIFSVLKSEVVDVEQDMTAIDTLTTTLQGKKVTLEQNFGKANSLELTNDIQVSGILNGLQGKVFLPTSQNPQISSRINGLLLQLQNLDKANSNWTLFHKKINSSTALEKQIDALGTIDTQTLMGDNDFQIQASKLDTLQQREIATRALLLLYAFHKLLHDPDYDANAAPYKEVSSQLDELETTIIPQIRGVYNAKRELGKLQPLLSTLKDLEQKKGEIDLGNQAFGSAHVLDLNPIFESGIVTNLESFKIAASEIKDDKGHHFQFLDSTGKTISKLETPMLNTHHALTLQVQIGNNWITLANLSLDNQLGDAKLKLNFVSDSDVKNALPTGENFDDHFPNQIEFPLEGVKAIQEKPLMLGGSKAGLRKTVKIGLQSAQTPPPLPQQNQNPPQAKDRNATISNVQNIHQEEADYLAGELDREEYDELGEFSIWKPKSYHPWARMKHFFSREYKKKKRIKKHLQAAKGKIDLRRNDVVTASDRHEYQHGDTLWKGAINQVVSNHHNPQIDFLCQSYLLDWTMTDEAFETQFNEIIKKDPQISKLLKNKKLDFLASNVLLKLKWERAEIKMVQGVETLLQNYKNKADFENQLKPLTDEYFSETQKNFPPELSSLLNAPDNKNAVELLVGNWQAQLKANVRNLKMQLQLLDHTEGAYQIDNKEREKHWLQRFGNWMDKHRVLTIGGSAVTGVGLVAAGSLIGGPLGAGITTGLLSLKACTLAAAKKSSHHTKEQKGQEQRLTHGLNIENEKLENIRTVMENAPRYSRRKYKARRQYQLYQETTQSNIADIQHLTKGIESFLSLPKIDSGQESGLQSYLIDGLVRLDAYRKTGHNFLGSQDRTKVEVDFRNLYHALLEGAKKLQPHLVNAASVDLLNVFRQDQAYIDLSNAINEDYQAAFINFKKRRRNLSLKYGLGAGMLYAATALGSQWILGSGVFGNTVQVSTTTFPGTSKLDLHEEVKKSLIKAGATSNQVNQIQSALEKAQAAHHGSGFNQRAWWTIVKNATGWNETQLNNWVHSFMKDTLRELNENGKSEIKNALLSTRLATMNVNDPWTTFADTYLSSPKIGLIKPGEGDQILQNLQAFLKGKNIATFSAQERMNMGYYAHLAIHNDIGIGSRLMKELTVNVTTPDQVIDEIHKITNHYRFDGIGMPVYANTYRKHLDPNDNERGTLLPNSAPSSIPTPQGPIVTNPGTGTSPAGGAPSRL